MQNVWQTCENVKDFVNKQNDARNLTPYSFHTGGYGATVFPFDSWFAVSPTKALNKDL